MKKLLLTTTAALIITSGSASAAEERTVVTTGADGSVTTTRYYYDNDTNNNGILDTAEFPKFVYHRWDRDGDVFLSDEEWQPFALSIPQKHHCSFLRNFTHKEPLNLCNPKIGDLTIMEEKYENREENKTRTSLVIAGIVIVALAIGFMFMDNPADESYNLSNTAPSAGKTTTNNNPAPQ
jgi:hypothetical protein